jgi:hypothetical protein
MGSHVDNFLKEVLKKENDNGQKTSKVANAVRQVHNKRTGLDKKAVSNQGEKKVMAWKLHQIKYHQATL